MANFNIAYLIELKDRYTKVAKKVAEVNQKVTESISNFSKKLTSFNGKLDVAREKMKKFGDFSKDAFVKVTVPIVGLGGVMTKLASDMEETMNKVEASLGKSAEKAIEWSKTSVKSMGLAQQTALDSVALYGDMATGMGISQEKASELGMQLTQLGADLASFKNISNERAQTALKGIFTGETEALKGLGVVMTQANLEEYAMSKGIRVNIKDMSQQQQVMLRYMYVMERTKNAQGDFVRTGGGLANQTRMLTEILKDIGVKFGAILIPYVTKAVVALNSLLSKFLNFSDGQKKFTIVLAGVIALIPALLFGLSGIANGILGLIGAFSSIIGFVNSFIAILTKLNVITKIVTGVQMLFNASLLANPITWVVAGIVLLVIAMMRSKKVFETVKNVVIGVWNIFKGFFYMIKIATLWIWDLLKPVRDIVGFFFMWLTPIGLIINAIKLLVGWIDKALERFGGLQGVSDKFKSWGKSIGDFWENKSKEQDKQRELKASETKENNGTFDANINISADAGTKITKTKTKSTGNVKSNVGKNQASKGG